MTPSSRSPGPSDPGPTGPVPASDRDRPPGEHDVKGHAFRDEEEEEPPPAAAR